MIEIKDIKVANVEHIEEYNEITTEVVLQWRDYESNWHECMDLGYSEIFQMVPWVSKKGEAPALDDTDLTRLNQLSRIVVGIITASKYEH